VEDKGDAREFRRQRIAVSDLIALEAALHLLGLSEETAKDIRCALDRAAFFRRRTSHAHASVARAS
jgi:hypothetical protein